MTFDFLAILIGLGATVLGLGAWFIKAAHRNESGQQNIENRIQQRAEHERLVRLGEEVVAELKAMHRANLAEHTTLVTMTEKLQGNVERDRPQTFLSDAGEFSPNSCLPPPNFRPNRPKNGGKTRHKHAIKSCKSLKSLALTSKGGGPP